MRLREKRSERLRASIRGTVPGVVTSVLAILGIRVVLLLLSQVLSGDTYIQSWRDRKKERIYEGEI